MAAVSEYPSLLRSEQMSLIQLYVPIDVAHSTVEELAELERVQFKDLNADVNPFQRTYVSQIRRCDEATRRLRFLTTQIVGAAIPIRELDDLYPTPAALRRSVQSGPQALEDLDGRLAEAEQRVASMNASYEALEARALELEEARQVLRETDGFFKSSSSGGGRSSFQRESLDVDRAPLLGDVEAGLPQGTEESGFGGFDLEFVTGTIDRSRMATFERVLWRILRGNLYMNYSEIDDSALPVPTTADSPTSAGGEQKKMRKNVFIIFAHGGDLLDKIRKIAESMGATLYPIDSSAAKREDKLREVTARIEDLNTVLYQTSQTRRAELTKLAGEISAWWFLAQREKVVFSTLNMWHWDQGRKTLTAEGWVPTRDIARIQTALKQASESAGGSSNVSGILHELKTHKDPPTFHRTNKVTEGFQAIIDAYGMASYQEVNPGLFTVVTFPFLFAVMFGDIGHGTIMLLSAASLIAVEKKFKKGFGNEIFDQFFFGRYIVLGMGLFALYTGLMYNDIFSLSLNFAKGHWHWPSHIEPGVPTEAIANAGSYYPFGLDPAWHGAENALVFTNSYKMKMSVVLGVIHMSFAICLQVLNHLHFKKPELIWAEFLPQLLFMESIFGYLIVCIIYKWSVDWEAVGRNPPNLLNMLIKLFLSPGNVAEEDQLYPGQGPIQAFLLLLALVCVPWMLCTKPYLLWKEHNAHKEQGYHGIAANGGHTSVEDDSDADGVGNAVVTEEMDEEHEFDLGEHIIHQVIHTIEFCLGCISNTASYLRLWALSLAHAQLSEVLWSMTIEGAFEMEGPAGIVFLFLMFAMWMGLSVAILVLMEGLSAFLHALRLHWVEFNSKFYIGAGTPFAPLTFAGIEDIPEGI